MLLRLCFRAGKNIRKDIPDMMERKLNLESGHLGSQAATAQLCYREQAAPFHLSEAQFPS